MAKKKKTVAITPFKDIDFWLKLFALGALFTGVFGLGFQKGMISAMGLGNLNGNYELREVFNSAVFGLFHLFTLVKEPGDLDLFNSLSGLVLITLFSGCLLGLTAAAVSMAVPDQLENVFSRLIKFTNWLVQPSWHSIYIYPIISALFAAIGALLVALFRYVMVGLAAFLLLAMLAGHIIGEAKINSELADDVCRDVDDELRKRDHLRQCTQIVINGRPIMGVVLLENQEGYFIKRNDAFAYIKKDGTGCIFSKFVLKAETDYSKQKSVKFSSIDNDLEEYCRYSILSKESSDV